MKRKGSRSRTPEENRVSAKVAKVTSTFSSSNVLQHSPRPLNSDIRNAEPGYVTNLLGTNAAMAFTPDRLGVSTNSSLKLPSNEIPSSDIAPGSSLSSPNAPTRSNATYNSNAPSASLYVAPPLNDTSLEYASDVELTTESPSVDSLNVRRSVSSSKQNIFSGEFSLQPAQPSTSNRSSTRRSKLNKNSRSSLLQHGDDDINSPQFQQAREKLKNLVRQSSRQLDLPEGSLESLEDILIGATRLIQHLEKEVSRRFLGDLVSGIYSEDEASGATSEDEASRATSEDEASVRPTEDEASWKSM